MSIVADIHRARAEFEDHVATHKCRARMAAIAAGETPCDVRLDLLQAWFASPHSAASMWGKEPDDDRRQREHHFRNVKNAPASAAAL